MIKLILIIFSFFFSFTTLAQLNTYNPDNYKVYTKDADKVIYEKNFKVQDL